MAVSQSRTKPRLLCWVDARGSRLANMGHRAEVRWEKPYSRRSLTAPWKDPVAYRRNGIVWSFMMKTLPFVVILTMCTNVLQKPRSVVSRNSWVPWCESSPIAHLLNGCFSEAVAARSPCNPLLPSLTVTQVKWFLAIHKAVRPCPCLAKQVSVEIK